MVEAMVQLAHGLGMTPLAEGIETAEELAFLREAGCTLGQGFLLRTARARGEIPALLARESLIPASGDHGRGIEGLADQSRGQLGESLLGDVTIDVDHGCRRLSGSRA